MTDLSDRKSLHKDFLECKSNRGIIVAVSQEGVKSQRILFSVFSMNSNNEGSFFFKFSYILLLQKEACMLIISGPYY